MQSATISEYWTKDFMIPWERMGLMAHFRWDVKLISWIHLVLNYPINLLAWMEIQSQNPDPNTSWNTSDNLVLISKLHSCHNMTLNREHFAVPEELCFSKTWSHWRGRSSFTRHSTMRYLKMKDVIWLCWERRRGLESSVQIVIIWPDPVLCCFFQHMFCSLTPVTGGEGKQKLGKTKSIHWISPCDRIYYLSKRNEEREKWGDGLLLTHQ